MLLLFQVPSTQTLIVHNGLSVCFPPILMSFRISFFLSLVLLISSFLVVTSATHFSLICPHILLQFGHTVWNLSYVGVFPFM